MKTMSFSSLVEQALGAPLPKSLADRISFPDLFPDARGVILRMLALMKRALYPATEFNPHMIWLLSSVTPAMLPSAWGGRIPPLTAPGRHRKLDVYVSGQTWPSNNAQPVFLDFGCGFPPATTVDTAGFMSDWFVFGVDRSFARYILYDAEGHYACFGRGGNFQYFQSQAKPLHENPRAVRDRFKALFAGLSAQLEAADDRTRLTVDKDGNRLVYNPIRDFETKNLKFVEAKIEDLQLPPVRVIRCMNVLLYFEKPVRKQMLSALGALLEAGGILISGFNHPFGIYARYAVYKKDAKGMRPCEFAFSPDNLRPLGIGPWLTLQDEDEEAEFLAELTGAIRSDRTFWPEFNLYVDRLREEFGICTRGADGFNRFTEDAQTALPLLTMKKTAALWDKLEAEGYTDGAVAALSRAGYKAWKNSVGDIAVLPPEGPFSIC